MNTIYQDLHKVYNRQLSPVVPIKEESIEEDFAEVQTPQRVVEFIQQTPVETLWEKNEKLERQEIVRELVWMGVHTAAWYWLNHPKQMYSSDPNQYWSDVEKPPTGSLTWG